MPLAACLDIAGVLAQEAARLQALCLDIAGDLAHEACRRSKATEGRPGSKALRYEQTQHPEPDPHRPL